MARTAESRPMRARTFRSDFCIGDPPGASPAKTMIRSVSGRIGSMCSAANP